MKKREIMELVVIICGYCGNGLPWCASKVAMRPKSDSDAKVKLQVSKVHLPRPRGARAWRTASSSNRGIRRCSVCSRSRHNKRPCKKDAVESGNQFCLLFMPIDW
jgi:hypothetical protein